MDLFSGLFTKDFLCFRWKLLDFAELKRSSISFFNLEKHETAISRWSRARTRAAKVYIDMVFALDMNLGNVSQKISNHTFPNIITGWKGFVQK